MTEIRDVGAKEFAPAVAHGRVLAEFWAPWCNPCKMMGKILEEAASRVPAETRIVRINVENSPETAAEFQVTSVPTFLLFENGTPVKRISGLLSLQEMLKVLDS